MFRLRWEVWNLIDKKQVHTLVDSDKSEKSESSLSVRKKNNNNEEKKVK